MMLHIRYADLNGIHFLSRVGIPLSANVFHVCSGNKSIFSKRLVFSYNFRK